MQELQNLNEPKTLSTIWNDTESIQFNMASEPLTCSLLRVLVASKPSGNFLELGSGTGLATAWMLDGMDAKSKLITVDNDKNALAIVHKHLGQDKRLNIICSDGDQFISSVKEQKFDIIFADAWPGKYSSLNETLNLVNHSGMYVIDDMLPQKNWPKNHSQNVLNLVAILEKRQDFHISKMCWASGIIIATKK